MVSWNKEHVESYAREILSSLLSNPMAAEELIAIGMNKTEEDQSAKIVAWSEHWANIAFDVAEVFAAEADQRDEDEECRVLADD